MWRPTTLAVIVLLSTSQEWSSSDADTGRVVEDRKADFYLRGVWNAVEQLRKGVVKISEAKTTLHGPAPKCTYLEAFDVENELVRHDRRTADERWCLARGAGQTVTYSSESGIIQRFAGTRTFDLPDYEPLDVRLLGLTSWGEVYYHWTYRELKAFLDKAVVDYEDDNGLARITWEYPLSNAPGARGRRTLWIDSSRGYTPTRMQMSAKFTSTDSWRVLTEVTSKWTAMSKVWVPISCSFDETAGGLRVDLLLNWDEINEPIDPRTFDYSGFGAPKGTRVWNLQAGEPLLEFMIGEERSTQSRLSGLRWFIIAGLVIGASAAALGRFCRSRFSRG